MGKARVQSSNAVLKVKDLKGNDIVIGEVDTCTARELSELKTSQPVGDTDITSQAVFRGWELSFEGGHVDWNLAKLVHQQDQQIGKAGRSPYFKVSQTITYFDGTKVEFVYENVTIYGYELQTPNQDSLSESFTGFSGKPRTNGEGTDAAGFEDDIITAMLNAMTDEKPVKK